MFRSKHLSVEIVVIESVCFNNFLPSKFVGILSLACAFVLSAGTVHEHLKYHKNIHKIFSTKFIRSL